MTPETTPNPPTALVSLHDVMPETFDRVTRILARLRTWEIPPITLLVVPGRAWSPAQINQLRDWAEAGHHLAAHGWVHYVEHIRGWRHRLHSRFLSRDVAEHLALDAEGILRLMRRSGEWFAHNDLPAPTLYVPPAWALGRVERDAVRALPFAQVEVLRGILDRQSGELRKLPVVGFETDTARRARLVRPWNRFQEHRARRRGRPLRIAIHPFDFEYFLHRDLEEILQRRWKFLAYTEL